MNKFYSKEVIKSTITCVDYLTREFSVTFNKQNRCPAVWRGGKNCNVSFSEDNKLFCDQKTKVGGDVFDLCALCKFNATATPNGKVEGYNFLVVSEYLGDLFGLQGAELCRLTYDYTKGVKYLQLVGEGYHEVKKYVYADENYNPIHFVIRMEHPTRKKEFIQCTPYGPSLKKIKPILYNLANVIKSDTVIVVEGEKDADTINEKFAGMVATTCNCGADHWDESYTEVLKGKNVIICRDNDEAGNNHAKLLLRAMANTAKSLKVICPSHREKGDVTDWIQEEGGTLESFNKLIKKAEVISPEAALWNDEDYAIYQAKKANEKPFSNFTVEMRMVKDKEKMNEKMFDVPRTIQNLISDVYTRFLGFPRRLGEFLLFDHDRDTGDIEQIMNESSLFAWMGQKSKNLILWKTNGVGFVTKKELFSGIQRTAIKYNKVSNYPHYPMRDDVYYTFDVRKSISYNDPKYYLDFLNMFCPEDEVSRTLLETFFASIMYYRPGIQKPCWVIDSRFGQGVGKSTVAEMACYLYGKSVPIRTSTNEINNNYTELSKRIISDRRSPMLLVDNVRGVFDSAIFADLVTQSDITGRPPYGQREETRPNDLNYVITANSINLGSDIASRSYIIYLGESKKYSTWKDDCRRLCDAHRKEILGYIYNRLKTMSAPDGFQGKTRTPEFEKEVLWAMAGDKDRYEITVNRILENRKNSNVDEERAVSVIEYMRDTIKEVLSTSGIQINTDNVCVFFRNEVINKIVRPLGISYQDVWNLVNTNKILNISKNIRRFPKSHKDPRCSGGMMYMGEKCIFDNQGRIEVPILRLDIKKEIVRAPDRDFPFLHVLKSEWMAMIENINNIENNKNASIFDAIDVESKDVSNNNTLDQNLELLNSGHTLDGNNETEGVPF